MNDWLSLTAFARRLQIPEPTARRYAKFFSDYLPHRKIGRMTLYAPDAGPILTRISELYSLGHKKEEISSILEQEIPKTIDIKPSPVQDAAALAKPENNELQEKLVQFLEIVGDQSRKIDALMERDNQTAANVAQLKQALESEQAHRRDLEQTSSQYRQALLKLYQSHKQHHSMIMALRETPVGGEEIDTSHITKRITQLEEMFLDDMGKLQQLMNQVLKKK